LTSIAATGLFCDDIRTETSGQHTLVGIYPDTLEVPQVPGKFPVLWLYIRIHLDPALDPGPMKVVIRLPDGRDFPVGDIGPADVDPIRRRAQDDGNPIAGVLLRYRFEDFQVHQAGRVVALLKTSKGDHAVASIRFFVAATEPARDLVGNKPGGPEPVPG
jgi:hypothetical protein